MKKGNKKKVLLGMSGGVDSSVAAYLLQKQGYEVIGVTLKLHEDSQNEDGCCSINAVEDARRVANKLGIAYYVLNMKELFRKYVIDYFINEYESGRTPNPCIACNKYIKFGALLDKANSLNIEYIATGHYAKIEKNDSRYFLRKAVDKTKDQSYVLYNLTQEQLSRTLFPLGGFTKKEIRNIAKDNGFQVASKPDSQEICFVEDNNYKGFIRDNSKKVPIPGEFITDDGTVIGYHKGITNYTIGQRRGLGIVTGTPMFVVDINEESNQILLGTENDLLSKELVVTNLNWIFMENLNNELEANVKIRYRAKESKAKLIPIDNKSVKVVFEIPQRAITKGQAAVFYKNAFVVGGGVIC